MMSYRLQGTLHITQSIRTAYEEQSSSKENLDHILLHNSAKSKGWGCPTDFNSPYTTTFPGDLAGLDYKILI